MESTTYNCYSAEDLQAQSKDIMTVLQNIQAALLKVAENDTNAGTLEEIKALLGMSTEEPSQSPVDAPESASNEPKTEDPSTDTEPEENTVTEPSQGAEPTTVTESHTVTVQPGDTLQTLAEKTGATPRHLIDLNMLMEPVVLTPGQSLKY